MDKFTKLVRDNTPQIIKESGKQCDTDILNEEYALEYLYIKLHEEIFDLLDTESCDELADILEIVFSIGEKYGYSNEVLLKRKDEKKSEFGGFTKNIILKKIY